MSDTAGNLTHDTSTNNPPKSLEFAIREKHADFLKSAQDWIDSVARCPLVIENDEINAKIGKTVQELMKARAKAETIHAAEKEPFLTAGRTVDSIFLAGVKNLALAGQKLLEARQSAYLTKKRNAVIAAEQAAADKAREEAAQALRDAERAQDAGETDTAMAHIDTAAAAEEAAVVAQARVEAKPAEQVRQHSALGVTISAKTEWTTEYVGPRDKVDWSVIGPYLSDAILLTAAKAAVKAGRREIGGFKISEALKAINR